MRVLLGFGLSVTALLAQSNFTRHAVSLGFGAGQPGGQLRGYFMDKFGLSIGYGYRFHPNFQADIGLDTVFGAAGIRDFYRTEFGELRIKDYQFLLPMGGRAILPLASGRLHFSGGGGGAYMRYQERMRQPFDYYRLDCPVCSSRGGWAYYGLLGANVALDRYQRFRLGDTSRVYRGHTSGDRFGQVGLLRTRDRWVNVFGEFSVNF